MKTSFRLFYLRAAGVFTLMLASGLYAQDVKQPDSALSPVPAEKSPGVVEPVPVAAPPAASATPTAVTPAPAEATAPAATDAPTESLATPDEPKLRRLDEPSTPVDTKPARKTRAGRHSRTNDNDIVNFGGDSHLGKGRKADSLVAVFGSATNEGEVSDQVVAVFGNTRITGPVGGQAVAVFGNVYVNGKIGDQVVAVFGNVELGPDAEVNDVVNIGGHLTRDPKAIVHGQINNVAIGGALSDFGWLHSWIAHCARYFRPLAFAPGLLWAWWIALGFLACYVLLAALFGKGVTKCVDTLTQRPGYSVLAALLTVLVGPIAMILLVFTGIGIAVIPFLAAALFFASLFGRAVMLAWIGRRLARLLGADGPVVAVLIGGIIVLLLYTIPVVGLIVYKLLGWIGLGAVVYALVSGMKRERPVVPPVITPPPGMTPSDPAVPAALLIPGLAMPPLTPALALPRAGFWIRTAALLLDVILIGMLCSFMTGVVSYGSHVRVQSGLLPALAIYGAVMWKLKGSTVGGIVCGLKVVRLDDRPIDWGTAIVRALSCFLSLVVMGLGFIWVAFDDQRQSWHDKIAGTTVVRVPKGVPLV